MSTTKHRIFRIGEQTLHVAVAAGRDGALHITEDEREAHAQVRPIGPAAWEIEMDGRRHTAYAVKEGRTVWAHVDGRVWVLEELAPGRPGAHPHGPADHRILAPMTGTVRAVHVTKDEAVTAGQPLVVLEAMKMEHVLRAPRDGVVDFVGCQTGEQVEAQALLASLAEEPAS